VGLLALEAFVFAVIAHASIAFFEQPARQLFVGCVSMASLISMFASPLAVMVWSLSVPCNRDTHSYCSKAGPA
jgi:solute carrier family 50 protein (sugar transporter)